jgi:hypothetical protein
MAIFCRRCGTGLGYPLSSVRTSKLPCDICGGFDPGRTDNYTYPDDMLPTASGFTKTEDDPENKGGQI